MKINGYEKFSMVDFEGKICCTVFTGGCNLRCPFCHNGALVVGDVKANQIDDGEVIEYLKKRKGLVDAVSVTGGEATLQPDLADFLCRVRELGYVIKLDTNGLRPDVLKSLIDDGLVDYVAMDIKNSPEKYPMTVGLKSVDLDKINESMRVIKDSGVRHEYRTTIIKEFHTMGDMQKIADWVSGANAYYMQKYKDSEGCISHGYHEIDKTTAEAFAKLFEGKVKKVGLRGYN
ncbi:MAG: anaerobic ribonucleoside-triphosphate reductase activating protein [Bacteroides sp.]|nr:anaerobic ribonucleoside-triphosphate reductase activating protein [Bacillota bacterium]MCM1393823.1 anaerobic ribonucleoside-triphosphate reductase activating protein [[Eubacterium] siraeum]MCM1455454.1 anaerobic ribonucleoside-triphosphate reductase activating protein [Bacteroides sp.]